MVDEGRKARIALTYLRQTTSVRAYTQDFQRLMLLAPETHELDQVVRFTLGLRGAIREEVDRGQPTTILQAMKLADEADVRLSGYRLERAPLSSWQQQPRRNTYMGPTGMELGSVSVSYRRTRPSEQVQVLVALTPPTAACLPSSSAHPVRACGRVCSMQ